VVTYYTVFVIDLASRRVQILGSTPHPDTAFMCQVAGGLTAADTGLLVGHRVFVCDRDSTWSAPIRTLLEDAGVRVVRTPFQAPNANAYAERFVRSIKTERLDGIVPRGERHLQQTMHEFIAHYHDERNNWGIGNELIRGPAVRPTSGRIRWRPRLGGLLNDYERAA
jgi:transposase InsO family protein